MDNIITKEKGANWSEVSHIGDIGLMLANIHQNKVAK
jgi:hypothetical protein